MRLLIDIGNSAVKWSYWEPDLPVENLRCQGRLENELVDQWVDMQQDQPESIAIACVGPDEIYQKICQQVQRRWQIEAGIISVRDGFMGLKIGYRRIHQFGVDRWLAILAAWHRFKTAMLLAGIGSAVTVDAISDYGEHLGGLIMPNSKSIQKCIYQDFPHFYPNGETTDTEIAKESIKKNNMDYGHSTSEGVFLGSQWAIVGAIESLNKRFNDQYPNAICVLTGGSALEIGDRVQTVGVVIEPDLVLQGMALVSGTLQ